MGRDGDDSFRAQVTSGDAKVTRESVYGAPLERQCRADGLPYCTSIFQPCFKASFLLVQVYTYNRVPILSWCIDFHGSWNISSLIWQFLQCLFFSMSTILSLWLRLDRVK